MAQPITAGCTIIPVLSGPHQIRVPTRIPIMEEVILQAACKEDPVHLQGILLRQGNTDRIHHIEAPEAIQFHPEVTWKEDQALHQVPIVILLQAAADLHHHLADLLVLTRQGPRPALHRALHRALHQALHQAEVVLLQEEDSLKQ